MENEKNKPIIVGLDPGTTAAIAIYNIETNRIEFLHSSKNLKEQKIIEKIIDKGKPVLIATDKAKTPSTISSIAKSLGISVYNPDKDLATESKKKIGTGNNSHEIDASAAAKKAYKNNRDKINKVSEISEQENKKLSTLLKKYFNGANIKNFKEKQKNQQKDQEPDIGKQNIENNASVSLKKHKRVKRKVKNLKKQIKTLRQEKNELEERNKNLKQKNTRLKEEERSELLEQRELRKMASRIEEKNERISELEKQLSRSDIREETYRKALETLKNNEAEIIDKVENINDLNEASKAVTKISELADSNPDIILKENAKGIELPNYYVLTGQKTKSNFKTLIKNYKERRTQKTNDKEI